MSRVLVLCGGNNLERNVSLSSGQAVAKGLHLAGHEVLIMDTTDPSIIGDSDYVFLDGPVGIAPPDELEKFQMSGHDWIELFESILVQEPDMIFPILHGSWGEDGRIQSYFELINIPYLGSDSLASRICMEKSLCKRLVDFAGVPVAKGFKVEEDFDNIEDKIIEEIGFPIVIKPENSGSAVDVFIIEAKSDVRNALESIQKHGGIPLIEQYIAGRELTVTVLDGKALPVIEIAPKTSFYDYTRKYTKGETNYLCPAPIDDIIAEAARRYAEIAFRELGCRDVARIDFRLSNKQELVFLEVNTIPGMTELSLVPMAAKETGMDFPALMQRFVELVQRRCNV